MKFISKRSMLVCMAAFLPLASFAFPAAGQSLATGMTAGSAPASGDVFTGEKAVASDQDAVEGAPSSISGSELPNAPEFASPAAPKPAARGGNPQREGVPWTAEWHQQPFSRIGIGADVSLLGIGIKATTPLNQYFDVRGLFNFFSYNQPRLEVDGFNIYGRLHLASVAAAVDFYPRNSVWRVSGGLFLYNGNQSNVTTNVVGGTSFSIDGKSYYSSTANPASGTVALNLNTQKAAPMFSFGFGRFVPHSNRHWSFPAEFGAIYMGVPSLVVTTAGDVCTDKAQTKCSSISDQSNPVGLAFNNSLNAQLAKWRSTLQQIKFYPIFSYSVVYSFNIR